MKKVGGVLAIMGVFFLILGFREGIAGMRKPVDLYGETTNVSEIGYFDMVEADIYATYGSFATKTTTENGKKTAEESYFLIPAYEGDDVRYIGIKVLEKDYKTFTKICDDTWDWEEGYLAGLSEHVVKTGCLKKMNKEMQNYYYKALKDAEWFESEAEMKTYALPLYIDTLASPKGMVSFLFVGLGLAVGGAVLFVIGYKKENIQEAKAAQQTYVVIKGVSYSRAELAHVNQCVLGQERIFAAQELSRITGMSVEEASEVVENWRNYYY